MPICCLCGLDKQLIKAHIISRKLYEPIRQASSGSSPGDQVPRMYAVGTTQKSKQAQNGPHDSNILCESCDGGVIGPWDNYGRSLLLNSLQPENNLPDNTGKSAVYKIGDFDYKKLKLFFISMLWRAAITDHPFFEHINLGPWEKKLRDMIHSQDPGMKHDFSVILFKYEGDFSEIMQNPSRQRQDGINFYRFRIPRYGFLVKVDQREFHSELHPFILSPNQPLLIRVLEYKNSKEYEQILDVKDQIPD